MKQHPMVLAVPYFEPEPEEQEDNQTQQKQQQQQERVHLKDKLISKFNVKCAPLLAIVEVRQLDETEGADRYQGIVYSADADIEILTTAIDYNRIVDMTEEEINAENQAIVVVQKEQEQEKPEQATRKPETAATITPPIINVTEPSNTTATPQATATVTAATITTTTTAQIKPTAASINTISNNNNSITTTTVPVPTVNTSDQTITTTTPTATGSTSGKSKLSIPIVANIVSLFKTKASKAKSQVAATNNNNNNNNNNKNSTTTTTTSTTNSTIAVPTLVIENADVTLAEQKPKLVLENQQTSVKPTTPTVATQQLPSSQAVKQVEEPLVLIDVLAPQKPTETSKGSQKVEPVKAASVTPTGLTKHDIQQTLLSNANYQTPGDIKQQPILLLTEHNISAPFLQSEMNYPDLTHDISTTQNNADEYPMDNVRYVIENQLSDTEKAMLRAMLAQQNQQHDESYGIANQQSNVAEILQQLQEHVQTRELEMHRSQATNNNANYDDEI